MIYVFSDLFCVVFSFKNNCFLPKTRDGLRVFTPRTPKKSTEAIDRVVSVNAFHENAVYVKREFAILMLFLLLSFRKPTFLS